MRVINKPFVVEMSNSSSLEFLQFSRPFEDDVSSSDVTRISRHFTTANKKKMDLIIYLK